MYFKILSIFVLFVSFLVCVNCLDDTKQSRLLKNSVKNFVIYENCTDCWVYNRMRCIEEKCYCAPDYVWDPFGKQCVNWICSSDGDCYQAPDTQRKCSDGKCVCRFNYVEDFANGRKCTFHLNVLNWVWVFFFILGILPIALIFYCRREQKGFYEVN